MVEIQSAFLLGVVNQPEDVIVRPVVTAKDADFRFAANDFADDCRELALFNSQLNPDLSPVPGSSARL